jgi:hypothetical protein
MGPNADRSRGQTRMGDSGSPVGSPLTIVLALIAVVVGFLIFRSIDNSDAGGPDPEAGATTTTVAGATTTVAGTATTAAPTTTTGRQVEGATVIIANASSASGIAAQMTEQFETAGYTTADPTDATGENLDTSIVYFVTAPPQIQAVAESAARDLGGIEVQPMPSPIPVSGNSIGTATVLVMLGNDLAGKSLSEIAADSGNVEAPAPAGGETATT